MLAADPIDHHARDRLLSRVPRGNSPYAIRGVSPDRFRYEQNPRREAAFEALGF